MKNLILILFISILLFSSCSDNNITSESQINTNDILLSKIVSYNLGSVYETFYSYEGKKIIQDKSYRARKEYTYSNNNIIQIKWFSNPNSDNILYRQVDFSYFPDGKLKNFKVFSFIPQINLNVTVEFTYNNDNINFNYIAHFNSNFNDSGYFKEENNEIAYMYSQSLNMIGIRFNYDNKNHPFKNVIGYDKLKLYNIFYESIHSSGFSTNIGCNSNLISETFLSSNPTTSILYQFEYNNNNFPKSININDPDNYDYLYY